jgi:hypothetical protein
MQARHWLLHGRASANTSCAAASCSVAPCAVCFGGTVRFGDMTFTLCESELAEAVAMFMDKDEKGAIGTFVCKSLEDTRQLLNKEVQASACVGLPRE